MTDYPRRFSIQRLPQHSHIVSQRLLPSRYLGTTTSENQAFTANDTCQSIISDTGTGCQKDEPAPQEINLHIFTRRFRSTTSVSSNLTKAWLSSTEPKEIRQRTNVLGGISEHHTCRRVHNISTKHGLRSWTDRHPSPSSPTTEHPQQHITTLRKDGNDDSYRQQVICGQRIAVCAGLQASLRIEADYRHRERDSTLTPLQAQAMVPCLIHTPFTQPSLRLDGIRFQAAATSVESRWRSRKRISKRSRGKDEGARRRSPNMPGTLPPFFQMDLS
ncbi:hypothetical protein ONZ45_g13358 [Pleurotus djamor]|nr:hypothetical protein ONZ45_g13358 [Pleurotus djamor]